MAEPRKFVENGVTVYRDAHGNIVQDPAKKDIDYSNVKVPPKPEASSIDPDSLSLGAIMKKRKAEEDAKKKVPTAKAQADALKRSY